MGVGVQACSGVGVRACPGFGVQAFPGLGAGRAPQPHPDIIAQFPRPARQDVGQPLDDVRVARAVREAPVRIVVRGAVEVGLLLRVGLEAVELMPAVFGQDQPPIRRAHAALHAAGQDAQPLEPAEGGGLEVRGLSPAVRSLAVERGDEVAAVQRPIRQWRLRSSQQRRVEVLESVPGRSHAGPADDQRHAHRLVTNLLRLSRRSLKVSPWSEKHATRVFLPSPVSSSVLRIRPKHAS
jgi:hypothetical protein